MKITELHIYPLKSARGISLNDARLLPVGLAGDREMLLVRPDGTFLTQRELPQLATLEVYPATEYVRFAIGGAEVIVSRPSPDGPRMEVRIWRSTLSASLADEACNTMLSEALGADVRLVFFDEKSIRMASPEWAGADAPVQFADGYPLLIATTGSLRAVNDCLEQSGEVRVPMSRFRPNIVLDCDDPWDEDSWAAININGIRVYLVKPCVRCVMTTLDQHTGERSGGDPLVALRKIRKSKDPRVPGVLFGWHAIARSEQGISVGMDAVVSRERTGA